MNIAGILGKCSSWQDFRGQLQSLPEKQKGDCFESLTKHFLQLSPEYVTTINNVWNLQNVPFHIRKYLNLPNPDEGIDLIAETKDGKYWAIQCKYRDNESSSLSRKELSTFTDLSFNICKHIELGLVCTNADRFSHKLTLYGERLSFCTGEVWRALDKEFFNRLHKLIIGKTAPLKPIKPKEHQKHAMQNAYEHFEKEKNSLGKLISPCGTGKSLTGYWIAQNLRAWKIIVAVPSLALIRQTLQVWARESVAEKRDIRWIAVCSDETVSDVEKDDVAVLTQDLGIRVHTDPDEIAEWLKTGKKDTTVVFTTYQSGKATAEAARKSKTVFDVGIFDEAHKTAGKKDSLFSYLLNNKNIGIKKRVFMTATERHYRGQSNEIVSMDDPEIYGDTFELLSFKKALETRPPILSDYKIVTISVSRDEIVSLIKENLLVKPDRGKWDREVEAEMLAGVIALRKAMKKYPIRHAVSFHSSIARARAFKYTQDTFSKSFPEYGRLDTFHVSGNTPTAVRSRELDEFAQAKRSLVTNARCLTEGVDVPNIDCVLFADPRKSTIDIVQAVGRALRTYEGKQLGYVIVPVLLENDVTSVHSQQSKAFDSILMVLRALAANDERIIEYFRTVSQGRKWTGPTIPVDIDIDIPEGLAIDADEFINSIKLQFWSRLAKLSWRPFEEAREFVHTLGLRNIKQWMRYCRGEMSEKGMKPDDIPNDPYNAYKDKGWVSYGDWLGTGYIAHQFREYRSYSEARSFVQTLELKSIMEWNHYCRGEMPEKGTKPDDIPANPPLVYKKEWTTWGDWLGTGTVATYLIQYFPFTEARTFVHRLQLKNRKEWKRYCRGELPDKGIKPENIPNDPFNHYKSNGWISWGDWLGTGAVASYLRQYRSFPEARAFVHTLGLNNKTHWTDYCKGNLPNKVSKPEDIPANPRQTYKDEWKGWGDWLGTGTIAPFLRQYRSFREAKAFVHGLALSSQKEWWKYCRGEIREKNDKPSDIPSNPVEVYKGHWKSWGDWLGTGTVHGKFMLYRPFPEARIFIRSLGLKNRKEWQKYCQGVMPGKGNKPNDIPKAPDSTYENKGWVSWGDWLGTQRIANQQRQYQPFSEAKAFVHRLGLKSRIGWTKYYRGQMPEKGEKPADIPSTPQNVYKNEWISWGDWLGTGTVAPSLKKYRTFSSARSFVHTLGLRNQRDWRRYCHGDIPDIGTIPNDIPKNPEATYKNMGWTFWGDWLGTGYVAPRLREYQPFIKARAFAQTLGLKTQKEWFAYCKGKMPDRKPKPSDIPNDPYNAYKDKGWISYPDWLGTKAKTSHKPKE